MFENPRPLVLAHIDEETGHGSAHIQNPNMIDDLCLRCGQKRLRSTAHRKFRDFVGAEIVQKLPRIFAGAANEAVVGKIEEHGFFERPSVFVQVIGLFINAKWNQFADCRPSFLYRL